MIYGLTFTWERGQSLAWLSNEYLHKLGIKHIVYFDEGQEIEEWIMKSLLKNGAKIEYKKDYHGGHMGYSDAMKKISAYKKAVEDFNIKDDDWLIDMDDDTIIATDKILELLTDQNSLVGIRHEPEFDTEMGHLFGHMSGACVAMRGKYLKEMVYKSEEWFIELQKEFKRQTLCEMWDVVVSYAMEKVGARGTGMAKAIRCVTGQDEKIWEKLESFFNGGDVADFFHLNESTDSFMGKPCPNSRYDIPIIFKEKHGETFKIS